MRTGRSPDTLLGSLRALLLEERAVDRVLELLTAGGLASTPPFVCAEAAPDGVRVVIRGTLEVVAHGLDGTSLTLGAGRSSTWNDDVVADIASLSVAGDSGARFEWVAATSAAPSAPVAPSTLPAATGRAGERAGGRAEGGGNGSAAGHRRAAHAGRATVPAARRSR